MFSLKKLRNRVYCLQFDNNYELCMSFLRYQEHYESPNDSFRNHSFTIAAYAAWYAKHQSEDNEFSYPKDWAGFNIPLEIVDSVHRLGISDPNHYDALMKGVHGLIRADEPGPSYLIGITDEASVRDHELTHAMFYLDEAYKHKCLWLFSDADPALMSELTNAVLDTGYAPNVVLDEIQAFITTGESDLFEKVSKQKELNALRRDLTLIHRQHFKKFL